MTFLPRSLNTCKIVQHLAQQSVMPNVIWVSETLHTLDFFCICDLFLRRIFAVRTIDGPVWKVICELFERLSNFFRIHGIHTLHTITLLASHYIRVSSVYLIIDELSNKHSSDAFLTLKVCKLVLVPSIFTTNWHPISSSLQTTNYNIIPNVKREYIFWRLLWCRVCGQIRDANQLES